MLLVGLNQLDFFVRVVVGDEAAGLFVLVLERDLLLDDAVGVRRGDGVHAKLHEVVLLGVLGGVGHYLRRRIARVCGDLKASVSGHLAV